MLCMALLSGDRRALIRPAGRNPADLFIKLRSIIKTSLGESDRFVQKLPHKFRSPISPTQHEQLFVHFSDLFLSPGPQSGDSLGFRLS